MRNPFSLCRLVVALVGTIASVTPAMAQVRYRDIPNGALAVVAEVRAKTGKEQALREVTLPLVAQVRAEPNNLVYFLHEVAKRRDGSCSTRYSQRWLISKPITARPMFRRGSLGCRNLPRAA